MSIRTKSDVASADDPRSWLVGDAPDRRWQLVLERLSQGKRLRRGDDPDFVRAYRFRKRWNATSFEKIPALADSEPEMYEAYVSYADVQLREMLEAVIIAGAPVSEAARSLGMSEGAVRIYMSVFFDVASRLDDPGWVMTRLCSGPVNESSIDETPRKIVAYAIGWPAFEMDAPAIFNLASCGDRARAVLRRFVGRCREHIRNWMMTGRTHRSA